MKCRRHFFEGANLADQTAQRKSSGRCQFDCLFKIPRFVEARAHQLQLPPEKLEEVHLWSFIEDCDYYNTTATSGEFRHTRCPCRRTRTLKDTACTGRVGLLGDVAHYVVVLRIHGFKSQFASKLEAKRVHFRDQNLRSR